jgi:ABC-2 type transport system ATP-binding protein
MSAIERAVSHPKDEKPSASPAGNVIVLEQLRMHYPATEAVAGIDLRVARGEIFAFLGPKGEVKKIRRSVEVWPGQPSPAQPPISSLGRDPSSPVGRRW